MKVDEVKILKFQDFVKVLEKHLGRKYNGMGSWNAPNVPYFDIDTTNLKDESGYMQGESKYVCCFYLNPLCEPGTWKDAEVPNDPEAFLTKFGMKATQKDGMLISIYAGLMWLVHKGELEMGDHIWVFHSW